MRLLQTSRLELALQRLCRDAAFALKLTMKVYDYKIAKAKNTDDLTKLVAQSLADGWQPLGQPLVIPDGIAQALVRHEE
jgi:hypothetical protein